MNLVPVYVIWHDAVSEDDWQDLDSAKELHSHQIHSLGFLIEEDKNRIVIALSLDKENDSASQTLVIPKTWMLGMKKLRVKL